MKKGLIGGILLVIAVCTFIWALANSNDSKIYDPSVSRWVKITKTFSDFSTVANTNAITIYTLPAKGVVHSVIMQHTTSFTGGGLITYTVSVGRVGSLQDYVTNSNVFQASSSTLFFTIPSAVVPTMYSTTSTTAIQANATSGVGNLSLATAGSVDFYLFISQLP